VNLRVAPSHLNGRKRHLIAKGTVTQNPKKVSLVLRNLRVARVKKVNKLKGLRSLALKKQKVCHKKN
jgi:hypothetical protein